MLGIIIPIDVHIFQRGGPTTNQPKWGVWNGATGVYPLVNSHSLLWKITIFKFGRSAKFGWAMCNSHVTNYQRLPIGLLFNLPHDLLCIFSWFEIVHILYIWLYSTKCSTNLDVFPHGGWSYGHHFHGDLHHHTPWTQRWDVEHPLFLHCFPNPDAPCMEYLPTFYPKNHPVM